MFRGEAQPAYKLYAFDRGWRVIRYVKDNIFARTRLAADWWLIRGSETAIKARAESNFVMKYLWWCVAGGYYLAGYAQFISAPIFVGLFLAIQTLAIGLLLLVTATAILCLTGFNFLYSFWYRAKYRCPNCHYAMKIPVFHCPNCGTEHTRLWPSEYGVLHHTCKVCGTTKLATLERLGRKDLVRTCPSCKRPLNTAIGKLSNVHIPVVGGPSSGKSNLIVMATANLLTQAKATGAVVIDFPDPSHEVEFQAQRSRLDRGQKVAKTVSVVPQAYNLTVTKTGDRVGKIVYFYDAAGEAYDAIDATYAQTYYGWLDGIILVVDPFAIRRFATLLGSQLTRVQADLAPSPSDIVGVFARMQEVLESSSTLHNQKFRQPLAIVVTKADACGLDAKIGLEGAKAFRKLHPGVTNNADAIDFIVQEFLDEYGLGNFVRDAKLRFETVRFFSTSALGRMPDATRGTPFVSSRAGEPLIWLLQQLDVLPKTSP